MSFIPLDAGFLRIAARPLYGGKPKAKPAKEKRLQNDDNKAFAKNPVNIKSEVTAGTPAATSEKPQIKTKESYMKSLRLKKLHFP